MAYKIQYRAQRRRRGHLRLPLCIALCFLLFCALVKSFWPDGALYLERIGFAGDSAVAVSALNDLADVLQYGNGLGSFLENLTEKIVH